MSNLKADKQEFILKRVLYICYLIYAFTLLYAMYEAIIMKKNTALGMSVVSMFLPFILPIGFRLLHFKKVYEIDIIAIVFLFFSSLLGSSFSWYSYPYFDKIVHFSSGLIFLLVAVLLFFYLRKSNICKDQKDKNVWIVFVNAVNIAIAVCWEFYEFAILVFFNNDAIRHYKSGVYDSMNDMLCATAAGILMTIYVLYCWKRDKSTFFTRVYEKFYMRNIAKG